MYAGNERLIYLLVTTEFKRTSQELGKLDEYSKKIAEFLNLIDENLLHKIKQLEISNIPNIKNNDSILVKETRNLHNEKHIFESEIMNIMEKYILLDKDSTKDKKEFNFNDFYYFYSDLNNQILLLEVIGIKNYNVIKSNIGYIEILNIKKNNIVKFLQIQNEEEKDRIKIIQKKFEENTIMKFDIKSLYRDIVIKGSDFRAIILNHHFFNNPYLHILYTVLKYDFIKKAVYIDIFVTTKQYNKQQEVKKKDFIPKMFDETLSGNNFADIYASKVYEKMKKDLSNYSLMMERIEFLNDNIKETNNNIDFAHHYIRLKLQKNFSQFMQGKTPIDDNQTKVKLCDLKVIHGIPANDDYNYVINRVKQIIKQRGILDSKSYTVIATSIELLKQNIIFEKTGEEDGHAEAILLKNYCDSLQFLRRFQSGSDMIYVIRLYQNGNIGCGLCCQRCVTVLTSNNIHRVIYSLDHEKFQYCNMDHNTYTYTTTGNKLLNTDVYLYDDFLLKFE